MFRKVLIANRGEIACRIIRTLRKMGIGSVAVYSDADASAQHVLMADEAIRLGTAPAMDSYLNVKALFEAIWRTGAEAVHPGYGFLSENAGFAEACEAEGIAFIGPTPQQLSDFGLKHRARELAEQFQVMTVPGSGLLANASSAVEVARSIGYPVMLKSTAGGGGIGMQVCHTDKETVEGFERICRLSSGNFKEAGIFAEKYIEHSRHIEVQIFGDGRGQVAILGERDCSIQRRHQKVIEETPAPHLPAKARRELYAAARRLAEGVAYRSAGTVEFIYDCDDGKFYFLEVNTRLQVEHGVTESVFGIDLVEWMVKQAAGIAPFRPGEFFTPSGAAMEFRIYAEDPGKNYQPSSGLVTTADFPYGVRCDTWIETGTEVGAWYDPLLAKIIVSGESRDEVIVRGRQALKECQITGFETNLELLRGILEMEKFHAGVVSTALLREFEYRVPTFEILAPGAQTTVQDYPGRLGHWDVGVPPSGPMDDFHFRMANRIVGNAPGTPGLEMTLSGASMRFNTEAIIALTGGRFPVTVNLIPIEFNRPIKVHAGDVLKVGATRGGQRCYLAVRGGIEVPKYLGSGSTFTLGRFGGHGGRALVAGDVLHIGSTVVSTPLEPVPSALPKIGSSWEIAVLYGPHGAPDYLAPEDLQTFLEAEWEVHYNSSRTGVRLIGPQFKWARPDGGEAGLHPSNLHDNAYAVGSLDFTGDMPVILGPDGPSLGGFVCPFTIVLGELWKVGQLCSGDKVRFIPITLEDATVLRHYRESILADPTVEIATPKIVKKALPQMLAELPSPIVAEYHQDSELEHIVCRQDGDASLLLEFGSPVLDLRLRFAVHAWMLKLQELHHPALIDLTPGIRSLQLHFDPEQLPQAELLKLVSQLAHELRHNRIKKVPARIVYLPLSWDDPATRLAIEKYVSTVRPGAPWCCPNNIEFIRRVNGLRSIDQVRETVFNAKYLVMGLGDVYLGAPVAVPLDPRHRLVTTKYNPARTWTPENAVGIGGAYLCVYGMEGPGGYQFVGRTVQMWNRFRSTESFEAGKPWLLRFFDEIRFYPVSAEELLQLRRDFITGEFQVRIDPAEFDIEEYERFLKENAESILEFEMARKRAFEEERQRWIATGQLTYETHASASMEPAPETQLEAGEEGVYAPAAGSIWKLNAGRIGFHAKAGESLAVMESMKTEIAVPAESECEVTQVFCTAGMEVRSGQCLFAVKNMSC